MPQPGPQHALIQCPVEDVMFGGARGGGKTDGLLGDFLGHAHQYGAAAKGLLFRRSYPELEEIEIRSREIYFRLGWEWQAGKRTWLSPQGARLKLRYLKHDRDAGNYQGHSYTWVGCDEMGNFALPGPVDKLRATMRSPKGIPVFFRGSANPGGVGHNWLKARYVDPAPPYTPFEAGEESPAGENATVLRAFIPSTLDDNLILQQNDPGYWSRVVMGAAGQEWLIKAWRYGLWDIVAGGMFDDKWDREVHVVRPFPIPPQWPIWRSFDWGSSSPFSVGWWARSDGSDVATPDGVRSTVRGDVFRVGEWYGWRKGRPNEGLKLLAGEVAAGIVEREVARGWRSAKGCRVKPGPADTDIFRTVNGNCIAVDMAKRVRLADGRTHPGIQWHRADKSAGTRKLHWEQIRTRLDGAIERDGPREKPGLFVFDTCTDFIRTVPVLRRDDKDPDDVDTTAEDHVADETGYFLSFVSAASTGTGREIGRY